MSPLLAEPASSLSREATTAQSGFQSLPSRTNFPLAKSHHLWQSPPTLKKQEGRILQHPTRHTPKTCCFDSQIYSRGRKCKPPAFQWRLHLKELSINWSLKPNLEEEEDPIEDDDDDDDDDDEDNTNITIAPKTRAFSKPHQIHCRAYGRQSISLYLENHIQEKDTTRFPELHGLWLQQGPSFLHSSSISLSYKETIFSSRS